MNKLFTNCVRLYAIIQAQVASLANCMIVVGYVDSNDTESPFPCSRLEVLNFQLDKDQQASSSVLICQTGFGGYSIALKLVGQFTIEIIQ